MKKLFLLSFLFVSAFLFSAQQLNNPIGTDGCYIVKWDCEKGGFASSNDFEADETFTFAIDITGTQWVEYLATPGSVGTRGIATNFSTSEGEQSRDGDRLYRIQGNIYGKTINLSQLSQVAFNTYSGSQVLVYSNLFGFEYTADNNGAIWYQYPSQDILPDGNCFFKTAPYTGTHTCPVFYTQDYAGNVYNGMNIKGWAAPCVLDGTCYGDVTTPNPNPGVTPSPEPVEGSQVYPFATDALQRGYYNRPYERYEAEPDFCTTNGVFLEASDDQATLQSEASHQQAVQLINSGSYVSWVVNKAGDGLTIRFSLPDGNGGNGTTGNIAIYAGNDKVGEVTLNSYWAWQYTVNGGNYPTNNIVSAGGGNVVRMKFDETHLRLNRQVAQGEVLKLVKTDNNTTPYTIDFVELEPVPAKVTFESLSGNKVQFTGGDVADFVANNQGRIIYIPEGKWETSKRIYLNQDGTQLIGAGMWYSEIYFTASSYNQTTFDKRGIEGSGNNLRVEGLYLNTVNNQRYFNNNDGNQVGKGFQGGMGNNSVIRNVWVEHFECGAWIADYSNRGSNNLLIEHCRFRNNYADGVNCCHKTNGHTIRYCSFRNNGDDDMAAWSTSMRACNISFAYCTAENNWRASSLGIFGGENHNHHHLYIVDALESGVRVNSDFQGAGFSQNGAISIMDVTIQHCGCKGGTRGNSGDFWGSNQGALNVGNTGYYEIYNVHFNNIDIYSSRNNALYLRAGGSNGKKAYNSEFKNIYVDGANYGIMFSNFAGTATYCNLIFRNVNTDMNNLPNGLTWEQAKDCQTTNIPDNPNTPDQPQNLITHFELQQVVAVYDIYGRKRFEGRYENIEGLGTGIYIVSGNGLIEKIIIL